MDSKVSFIVPCYKLGHLLAECVQSILSQSFQDLEVLIMDDCSPDQTPEVARSFDDPRVKYIRNEANLGQLRNYNKGIELSTGKYVWLISADDRLRRPYIVDRYVRVMEAHPEAGYVFCPAVRLEDGREGEVIAYSVHGNRDRIFDGQRFMSELLMEGCTVVSASGMVRRDCYETISLFPLDLPWGGDWYLWCLFALHHDVAYLAEPMVNYRRHALCSTDALVSQQIHNCAESDVIVPRRLLDKAEEAGVPGLVEKCKEAIAGQYAKNVASRRYKSFAGWHQYSMTLEEFERSLSRIGRDAREKSFIRARTYAYVADNYYWQQDFGRALQFYRRAIRENPMRPKVWMKYLLLRLGHLGIRFRSLLSKLAGSEARG